MHQYNGPYRFSATVSKPSCKTLIDAGLIFAEKDGRNHTYLLNKALLKAYGKTFAEYAAK